MVRKNVSVKHIRPHLLQVDDMALKFTEYDLPVKATSGSFKKGLSLPAASYRTMGVTDEQCNEVQDTYKIPEDIHVSAVVRGEYNVRRNNDTKDGIYREFVEDKNGKDILLHAMHPTLMTFSEFDKLNDKHLIELFSQDEFAAVGVVSWYEFGLVPVNGMPDHAGVLNAKLVLRNALKRVEVEKEEALMRANKVTKLKGFHDFEIWVQSDSPAAVLPDARMLWTPLSADFASQVKVSDKVITKAVVQGALISKIKPGDGGVYKYLETRSHIAEPTSYFLKLTLAAPATYSRETFEIMRTNLEETAKQFIRVNSLVIPHLLDFDMDSMTINDGYVAGYPTLYVVVPNVI